MNDNTHYTVMAQQFLDFWQEQTRRAMQDERFLQAMMDMMGAATPAATSVNPFSANVGPYATSSSPATANSQQPFTHAAHASGVESSELLRRIERLEARVAAAEDALRTASTATPSAN